MARHWKIVIVTITALAAIGLATLPALLRTVLRLRGGVSEEQARRELSQPLIATPSDTRAVAQLYWISANSPTALEAVPVELPLSAEPVQRAKQLITALISRAPTPAQRTLPADAELLQFYLLPDGTAIADFSETLSSETPSGILSEQLAVDSLRQTLGANVSGVRQLKILIRGLETDTLAGHLDLADTFPVETPPGAAAPGGNAISVAPGAPPDAAPGAGQPPPGSPAQNVVLPLPAGSPAPANAAAARAGASAPAFANTGANTGASSSAGKPPAPKAP